MLPENILKSDVLDIVFENRNKSYGAYALRKYYPQRLQIALGVVGIFALLLALLQQIKPEQHSAPFIMPRDTMRLVDVFLPPPTPKTVKPLTQQHVQTADDRMVVVVPDNQVHDTIATVAILDVSALGSTNLVGEPAVAGENAAPAGPASNGDAIKAAPVEAPPNTPVEVADKMPEFPGGMNAFMKFMQRNLRRPDELESGQKVVVLTKFVVQADGSISDIQILQHGTTDLDREVIRVINKMPKWIPGLQRGKSVAVYFKLPVTFVAQE